MENIIGFPDREVIEDEALEWLIRLDGDKPLSASEEKSLDAWLARSPVHREALKSLNIFWSNSNVLGELAKPHGVMQLCGKHIVSYFWPLSNYNAVAASAALLMLCVGVMFSGLFNTLDIAESNGVYLTAVGQQKNVTLADGSHIQLNTNSQIQVDYDNDFRNIRLLQGEVHFEVSKDPSKPFRVYAGSGRVQAVGTAFNVYLKKEDVNVFVTEGSVSVASILPLANSKTAKGNQTQIGVNKPLVDASDVDAIDVDISKEGRDLYAESEVNGLGIVAAGEGVTLKKTAAKIPSAIKTPLESRFVVELVPTVLDQLQKQNARLAWRQGQLIFNGESLEEMVAEIGRYTSVNIEIVDPELRDIAIGGQIQLGDTNAIFKALEASFGLKINRLSYNRVQIVAFNQSVEG